MYKRQVPLLLQRQDREPDAGGADSQRLQAGHGQLPGDGDLLGGRPGGGHGGGHVRAVRLQAQGAGEPGGGAAAAAAARGLLHPRLCQPGPQGLGPAGRGGGLQPAGGPPGVQRDQRRVPGYRDGRQQLGIRRHRAGGGAAAAAPGGARPRGTGAPDL